MTAVNSRATPLTGPRWLVSVLLAIAALATLVPAALVRYGPHVTPARPAPRVVIAPRRVVPPAELPPVEPVAFVQLAPEDARAYNASVPFVDGPIPPARPFRFAGSAEDRARAVDCLAAAVNYEAGDDTGGERAVAQVVLNRVRHPAYPKTVCGVVFEGSERSTGCQFTFTCDGALTRRTPSPAAWARARAVATAALTGKVDRRVGWATHYHTDYVVPYWQSSLDKIAAVGTHLFFRWTGFWGTPGAFHDPGARPEPAVAALAALSDVHRIAAGVEDDELAGAFDPLANSADAAGPAIDYLSPVQSSENDALLITLPRDLPADQFPALAARNCGARAYCKLMAWTPLAGVPAALPLTPRQQASMGFSYLRDRARGFDKALWNCQQFKRANPAQCMKGPLPASTSTDSGALPSPGLPPRGPGELKGARRAGSARPDDAPPPPGQLP